MDRKSVVISTRFSSDMQRTESCEDQESDVRTGLGDVGQYDPAATAAMFVRSLPTGGIHQDATHRLRGGVEEVPAAVPAVFTRRADQPEVRFVDQGGRLEGVVRRFGGHAGGGEPPQLVVHERKRLRGGLGVASRSRFQKSGHISYFVPSISAQN